MPAPQAPQQQPQAPVSNQKPIIQYVEKDPSLSSLRVKAEKEKELSEAETYWRKRFVQQEQEVSLQSGARNLEKFKVVNLFCSVCTASTATWNHFCKNSVKSAHLLNVCVPSVEKREIHWHANFFPSNQFIVKFFSKTLQYV